MDIGSDVDRRLPGLTVIGGAEHTANVDIHVNDVAVLSDRARVGGAAPGRKPVLAAGRAVKRWHSFQTSAGDPIQVAFGGPKDHAGASVGDAVASQPAEVGDVKPPVDARGVHHFFAVEDRPQLPPFRRDGRDLPPRVLDFEKVTGRREAVEPVTSADKDLRRDGPTLIGRHRDWLGKWVEPRSATRRA